MSGQILVFGGLRRIRMVSRGTDGCQRRILIFRCMSVSERDSKVGCSLQVKKALTWDSYKVLIFKTNLCLLILITCIIGFL